MNMRCRHTKFFAHNWSLMFTSSANNNSIFKHLFVHLFSIHLISTEKVSPGFSIPTQRLPISSWDLQWVLYLPWGFHPARCALQTFAGSTQWYIVVTSLIWFCSSSRRFCLQDELFSLSWTVKPATLQFILISAHCSTHAVVAYITLMFFITGSPILSKCTD